MFGFIIQLVLVFIISCLSVFYLLVRSNYGYWKKRGVPYEEPKFVFGNLSFLMRRSFWDVFYDLSKKYKKHDYVGIFMSWKPALMLFSKDLSKKVLVKDTDSFQDRYSYSGMKDDPLGSLNLFSIKSPMWVQMRNELSPMFTSLRLKGVTELMNINSTELVRRVQKDYIDQNKPVDLKELFSMYTSDTVAYTVFGIRVSVLKELASPLWDITQHMVRWTFWRGLEFTLVFFLPAIAEVFRLKFFSQPATEHIKKLFNEVVAQRKKTGETNDKDLVNHLLKLKANLKLPAGSDAELADNLMMAQVAVFILGSIETSSTTLAYMLNELAYHPDEQEKLYHEVTAALKETGKEILQYDDLMNVKYLTACMHETLRKYPPVAHLDRVCNKAYQLTENLTIEPGTPVYVNVVAIHHNEDYYPEPEEWKPERFINSTDSDNHDFTFLPFGEGPRFCIGKRYGMMQIRTAIAQLITKYRFEPAAPKNLGTDPYSVLLAPKNGGKVKFVPRT
ncbi:cytochrome P450 6l1 [Spodoptera frugiperda]|uniref:unspecific monooxygenase n=1 Tax=Spodoptera frugiperda TaxID=7108 RepID=A0A9R0DTK6_SPOFR|nr:cytochrome P450 6l1 [Spodoptera frugiperda]